MHSEDSDWGVTDTARDREGHSWGREGGCWDAGLCARAVLSPICVTACSHQHGVPPCSPYRMFVLWCVTSRYFKLCFSATLLI